MKKLWAPWRLEYIINAQYEEDCIFCTKPKESTDKENLIVYRSQHCFVILNKYPYNNGHVMVVPYLHTSDLTSLTDDVLLNIQQVIQLTIKALNRSMKPHGINVGINLGRTAGAGIDEHLHYHLVPRWDGDTNFMPILAETKVISEGLAESWEKLRRAFDKLS
jgi:ATP adenylyltransferase